MLDVGQPLPEIADLMSFWTRAKEFPPVFVRIMARHKRGDALTNEEIAERSGLTHYAVYSMSVECSWAEIAFGDMEAFLKACNLDFCDRAQMRRLRAYAYANSKGKIRNKFAWLKRDPNRDYFQHLIRIWQESRFG